MFFSEKTDIEEVKTVKEELLKTVTQPMETTETVALWELLEMVMFLTV